MSDWLLAGPDDSWMKAAPLAIKEERKHDRQDMA